jgi:xylulokinase
MLLLGIDVGTSSVKVSVVDAASRKCIVSTQYPEQEAAIKALQPGWAEQSPESWWSDTCTAILKLHQTGLYDPLQIAAIGIAYQMHGLVLVDKNNKVIRDSIIWCDSRAVTIGEEAMNAIGAETCLSCLLNSPGNFTASKLGWVKKTEPELYARIHKMMLPGDFIALRFTGDSTTTSSALSEGILWDFSRESISPDILTHFGFHKELVPQVRPLFSSHGTVRGEVAAKLSLKAGIPVSYKAGDQLNNALSLNVLETGEVAATAGTSGVIYAVTDKLFHEPHSRVNAFAHVNHSAAAKRLGVLLCINGTGIMNSWTRNLSGGVSYSEMNKEASAVAPGSDGLFVLPFGNGAERMLQNKQVGAHIFNLDLNRHSKGHIFRAVQEGIAFSFRYGLDLMRSNGLHPGVIRAGRANMFLSEVFTEAFVNATGVPVELYENDGSVGAALGAGIGAGIYKKPGDAFSGLKPLARVEPRNKEVYERAYQQWKLLLEQQMQSDSAPEHKSGNKEGARRSPATV